MPQSGQRTYPFGAYPFKTTYYHEKHNYKKILSKYHCTVQVCYKMFSYTHISVTRKNISQILVRFSFRYTITVKLKHSHGMQTIQLYLRNKS